jgi:hypothetical protein
VIADAKLRHLGADGRHDAGDLMTQHRRCRKDGVRGHRQVRVTEPRRSDLDEHFATDGRRDLDVLALEAAANCVEDQGLHGVPLVPVSFSLSSQRR